MSKSLLKKALLLSYVTVGYNLIEAAVSLFFGAEAESPALIGFGLDSVIESLSGGIMIWRFTTRSSSGLDSDGCEDQLAVEKREMRAIVLVGYSFFALSALTLYESISALAQSLAPSESPIGIIIACSSLVVMPILFFFKRNVARDINSQSLQADARQTLACWMLSFALLLGLLLNHMLGLWWADPLAGLVIGVYLLKEGISTLKRRQLCSC